MILLQQGALLGQTSELVGPGSWSEDLEEVRLTLDPQNTQTVALGYFLITYPHSTHALCF
jgi:hypothetical protein